MRGKHFVMTKQNLNKIISLLLVLVMAFSHAMMLRPVFADDNEQISLVVQKNSKESDTTFGKKISRSKFESINFVDNTDVIDYALDYWSAGIDENGNMSDKIKAWYTDFEGNGLYELYIGQTGGVIANQNSSYMFEGFTNVKYINIENLRLENALNISNMFDGDGKLETIYVSSNLWIDSNAEASDMFKDCNLLVGQNGTKFDSSIIDGTYARADGKDDKPGYFTEVVNDMKESYVVIKQNTSSKINIKESNNVTSNKLMTNNLRGMNLLGSPAQTKTITITKTWDDDGLVSARPDYINVYIIAKTTTFVDGTTLNTAMKRLSGSSTGVSTINTNITAIKKANALDTSKTYEIVSTTTSNKPIYMWYDNGTIYYYTEANKVYLNKNSSSAFRNLRGLTDISGLANVDSGLVSDMTELFNECISLNNISPLANWDTSNVTTLDGTFKNCTSITDLSPLANWNTSNVTDLTFTFGAQNAFIDKINATGGMQYTSLLPLANWDTSKVTSLNQTFKGATVLTSLEGIGDWDVSLVTNVIQMLESTFNVASYDEISEWNLIRAGLTGGTIGTRRMGEGAAFVSVQADFTNRPGSWSMNGADSVQNSDSITYIAFESAQPAVVPVTTYTPPPGTYYQVPSTSWVKSGNTWTATIEVNDEFDYYGYEDEFEFYTGDATISNPKDVVNNTLSITNTLDRTNTKQITITKIWDDQNDLLRPDELTFTIKNDAPIPVEYQTIEYIKTAGGYIDTDIDFNESYTIYGDGNSIGAGYNGSIIDGYKDSSYRTGNYMLTGSAASPNLRWQVYWTGISLFTLSGSATGIDMTQRYQFTQNKDGITLKQGSATYSRTYSGSGTKSTTGKKYRIAGNIQNSRSQIYFYNAKIYDSDGTTLLHNFEPVYRKSDDKIGVYDTVGEKFYPGTGTMTKGQDLPASAYSSTQTFKENKWTKVDNNTWETIAIVDKNAQDLKVYEHDVEYYNTDATLTNPADIVNNEVTITNTATHTKIAITKKWNDANDLLGKRLDESDFDIYLKYGSVDAPVDQDTTWTGWTKTGSIWAGSVIVTRNNSYYAYETGNLGEYTTDAPVTNQKQVVRGLVTITNTLSMNKLTVKKEITGTMADMDKTFNFQVSLLNNDNTACNINIANQVNTNGSVYMKNPGIFNVTLKMDQYVEFTDLAPDVKYVVSEVTSGETATYDRYYKITNSDDGTVVVDTTQGDSTPQRTLTDSHTVTFTNNKELSPLTGLVVETGPYGIMIIMVFIVVAIYVYDSKMKIKVANTSKTFSLSKYTKIKDINHIAKHIKTSIFSVRLFNIRRAKKSK